MKCSSVCIIPHRVSHSPQIGFFSKSSHCFSNCIPPTFRKIFGTFFIFSILCNKEHGAAANADVFSVAVTVVSLNFMALAGAERQEVLLDWTCPRWTGVSVVLRTDFKHC
jgi:hypothetical protein